MDSETLKIIGVIIGGVGTVVGAIAKFLEVREATRDRSGTNQLHTKFHRWNYYVTIVSFCIGALGLMVSLGIEVAEQQRAKELAIKQAEESQRTIEQFQRLLTKIDTISFGMNASLYLEAAPLASFLRTLQSAIQTSLNKTGQERLDDEILSNLFEIPGFDPTTSIALNSYYRQYDVLNNNYFKTLEKRKVARDLIFPLPHVAIFRTPIDPLELVSEPDRLTTADLSFEYPFPSFNKQWSPIRLSFFWHPDPIKPFKFTDASIEYPQEDIPAERWSTTNKILSLKDLEGAQMIIFTSSKSSWRTTSPNSQAKWNATMPAAIQFTINKHPIKIDITKLVTTRQHGRTVHSYIFPKLVDF